mmetsp:Transcript_30411/g.101021  ORF Transcript_30411/g.101021 Transcript_30411/m.101021 type:complete len:227 (+) Transcript_30411:1244-1924(+)
MKRVRAQLRPAVCQRSQTAAAHPLANVGAGDVMGVAQRRRQEARLRELLGGLGGQPALIAAGADQHVDVPTIRGSTAVGATDLQACIGRKRSPDHICDDFNLAPRHAHREVLAEVPHHALVVRQQPRLHFDASGQLLQGGDARVVPLLSGGSADVRPVLALACMDAKVHEVGDGIRPRVVLQVLCELDGAPPKKLLHAGPGVAACENGGLGPTQVLQICDAEGQAA